MKGRGLSPVALKHLQQYNVNREGAVECIWAPRYDWQTYASAGTTSMRFFQVPNGQSSKTIHDTNMDLAGQLPAPQEFLITSIEVAFIPVGLVSFQGAQAVDAYVNDIKEFGEAGALRLSIGSKDYVIDAPLGKFPPSFRMAGFAAAADVTTAGGNLQHRTAYATWAGPIYDIAPLRLIPTQNFAVTITWASAVAVSQDARIGVYLNGWLYRLSQ